MIFLNFLDCHSKHYYYKNFYSCLINYFDYFFANFFETEMLKANNY